jgi:cation diffusion facilitator family transporter
MNLGLFSGKLFAGFLSNSIAIIADAFNSLADCASALVTMIGFKMAARKGDAEHPYGHGRAEYIAGFLIAVVIILTAWSVGEAAVRRLMNPEPVEFQVVSVVILAVAILAKMIYAWQVARVNRRADSRALDATMVDSMSDCLATALSVLPILLVTVTDLPIDGILGVVLALFIVWSGFRAFWSNTTLILGQGLTQTEHGKIHDVVRDFDIFDRVSSLAVHDYGPEARILLVKVHLAMAPHTKHFEYEMERCKKVLRDSFGFEEVVIYWPPNIRD